MANCPKAMVFSFNLWSDFLGQSINPVPPIILKPGQHLLFWADDDPEQGPTHTNFKLSRDGEQIALFDTDGKTIYYLDINSRFLTADGELKKDIMPDFLHPSAKGYQIWAEAIEPKVAELMGEK